TLLVATNPLLLYFANTGELYAYDVAFSAFLILLLVVRPARFPAVLFYLYGLAGAFRLSSVMLAAPVVLFVLWQEYQKDRSIASIAARLAAILLGVASWF